MPYADKYKQHAYVVRKRQKKKIAAVAYKGGKCVLCGYSKNVGSLAFHHLDPNGKEFGIGGLGVNLSWERLKQELDKCVLLCHNCHGEVHSGMVSLTTLVVAM